MKDKEIIQALKENEKAFGLMSEDMRVKARDIGNKEFCLYTNSHDEWMRITIYQDDFDDCYAYCLRSNYEEKPEIVECEIKIGRNDLLYFDRHDGITSCCVPTATKYPDFIGFKYEDGRIRSTARCYSHTTGKYLYMTLEEVDTCKVLTPTHVLFRKG